jgi:hypothetical protein
MSADLSRPNEEELEEDHAAEMDSEDVDGGENFGGPTVDDSEAIIDEATSGFLEKVNSGTINSAQFLPAIVDLPETVKVKKKRVRKPKVKAAAASSLADSAPKKKRKRDSDSSDEEFYDDDAEYKPKKKAKKPSRRSSKSGKSSRATKAPVQPARRSVSSATGTRKNNRREPLFSCRFCDFKTETIGRKTCRNEH